MKNIEYRTYQADYNLCTKREDTKNKIIGHAAVFNSPAGEPDFFMEIVLPGAFTDSIAQDDIRALWNHNSDFVLGRNKSGTLFLQEDDKGLLTTILPSESQLIHDMVLIPMERGDITQMSFGFTVINQKWEVRNGVDYRIIEKVKLWDVSPVTYPFYQDTDVTLRGITQARQLLARGVKANIQKRELNIKLKIGGRR